MGAIFLDKTLSDRLKGWTPPQLSDGVHEVWVEGKSEAPAATKTVPLLHGKAVDLPSTKLPGNTTTYTHTQRHTDFCSLSLAVGVKDLRHLFNKLC